MTCPNCGTEVTNSQQFCRSCGAALKAYDQRPVNHRVLWGLIVTFAGIVLALIGKMVAHQELIVFAGVVAALAGMFFIAAYPFLREAFKHKSEAGGQRPLETDALPTAERTSKLPAMDLAGFIPIVTEDTTELLKQPIISKR